MPVHLPETLELLPAAGQLYSYQPEILLELGLQCDLSGKLSFQIFFCGLCLLDCIFFCLAGLFYRVLGLFYFLNETFDLALKILFHLDPRILCYTTFPIGSRELCFVTQAGLAS